METLISFYLMAAAEEIYILFHAHVYGLFIGTAKLITLGVRVYNYTMRLVIALKVLVF